MEVSLPATPVHATDPEVSASANANISKSVHVLKHPHGLSSNRETARFQRHSFAAVGRSGFVLVEENINQGNQDEIATEGSSSDCSIEKGRASLEQNRSAMLALESLNTNTTSPLNKLKRKNSNDGIFASEDLHSPSKMDYSSPIESPKINEDSINKRPKLAMNLMHDLSPKNGIEEDETNDRVTGIDSPLAIEMIDSKISPNKSNLAESFEFHGVNKPDMDKEVIDKKGGFHEIEESITEPKVEADYSPIADNKPSDSQTRTPKRTQNDIDISSFHKLTPLFAQNSNILATESKHTTTNEDLNASHKNFLMISNRNEELTDQLHDANRRINSLMLKYEDATHQLKTISLENEEIRSKHKAETQDLQQTLDQLRNERDDLQVRRDTLKTRVSEVRDEIDMLNQNQKILQEKYDTAINEKDHWRLANEDLNNQISTLRETIKLYKKTEMDYQTQFKEEQEKISTLEKDKKQLSEEIVQVESKISELQDTIRLKDNRIDELSNQLKETLTNQEGTKEDFIKRIEELIGLKTGLEQKLEEEQKYYKTNLSHLEQQLSGEKSNTIELEKEVKSLSAKTSEFEAALRAKEETISILNKNFENVDDDAKIRTAEVNELNQEITSLRESKLLLENQVNEKLAIIGDWQNKFKDLQTEYEKVSFELESLQLKNSNIQAEYFANLENLTVNVNHLEANLKSNLDTIEKLEEENALLKKEQSTVTSTSGEKFKEENHRNETVCNEDDDIINKLRSEIKSWEKKLKEKEEESNEKLKLLADDLYRQYASKHEQKVKMLKKNYESKYNEKIRLLLMEKEGLAQEITRLEEKLNFERNEKRELVRVLEDKAQ